MVNLLPLQRVLTAVGQVGRRNCLLVVLAVIVLISLRFHLQEASLVEADEGELRDADAALVERAGRFAREEGRFLTYLRRLDAEWPEAPAEFRLLSFWRAHKRRAPATTPPASISPVLDPISNQPTNHQS
jgi:hypothetical protein